MRAAGDTRTAVARAAVAELCETYWYPLYAYVRRSGHTPEDAADLVQGFLLSLWERRDFDDLEADRGRFRAFLLGALKHFVSNRRVHDRAGKRGGGEPTLSLEFLDAEQCYQAEPATTDTPESAFERQWATRLLAEVFAEIRTEWAARGKTAEFERLKEILLDGRATGGGYTAAARDLGTTETALRMSASRLRRRFLCCLREMVAETTMADDTVDDELRYLLGVLRQ